MVDNYLTDEQIEEAKKHTQYTTGQPLHEHYDCVRIAYEWLDAQQKTKRAMRRHFPIKHMVESWGGRYVSQSDVEVAAALHPGIKGTYPYYNISSRLTWPSEDRLANIGEAFKHPSYRDHYPPYDYANKE